MFLDILSNTLVPYMYMAYINKLLNAAKNAKSGSCEAAGKEDNAI